MTDRIYAFGYYGGKLSHLKSLLPLLPKCQTFVEAFGGSGAVLLNRDPSPVEVYNDLDGAVVNFFRVLRNQPETLTRAIALTPYARSEFADACEQPAAHELERARRFFIRVAQSRYNLPHASSGQWSYCVTDSNRGMSSAVSAWLSNVEGLQAVAKRLLQVQVENLPALNLICRYDTPRTLFYVDPPYVAGTRQDTNVYAHEMTDSDHADLAAVLKKCVGSVAISGYDGPLYEELYGDWCRTDLRARTAASTNTKGARTARQEILWTNYDPAAMDDLPLFMASEATP